MAQTCLLLRSDSDHSTWLQQQTEREQERALALHWKKFFFIIIILTLAQAVSKTGFFGITVRICEKNTATESEIQGSTDSLAVIRQVLIHGAILNSEPTMHTSLSVRHSLGMQQLLRRCQCHSHLCDILI